MGPEKKNVVDWSIISHTNRRMWLLFFSWIRNTVSYNKLVIWLILPLTTAYNIILFYIILPNIISYDNAFIFFTTIIFMHDFLIFLITSHLLHFNIQSTRIDLIKKNYDLGIKVKKERIIIILPKIIWSSKFWFI